MFWWFLSAFLLILFFMLLLVLYLLPLGLTAHSVVVLFTAIPQLLAVARDRQRRRHHALEHATINVLEERAGTRLPVSGLAVDDGFHLSGPLSPATILDAAEEALARLERGETHLALHPRCGTTIVAGQLLFALTLLLVFLFWPEWFWAGMLLALGVAMGGARPFSMVLQRFLTTDANVHGLAISHVEPVMPASVWQFLLMVRTGSLWKVVVVETSRPGIHHVPLPGTHKRYRAF